MFNTRPAVIATIAALSVAAVPAPIAAQATGDLAARKLFPGLYKLAAAGRLPDDYAVIGSGRHSPGTDEEFRQQLRDGLADTVDDLDDAELELVTS